MKQLVLVFICILLLAACSKQASTDYEEELKEYEDRIRTLEIALDETNNSLDLISNVMNNMENQLALYTGQIEDLTMQIEGLSGVDIDTEESIGDDAEAEETRLFQVRDDISVSPYTLAELADIHQTVEDGADLNMYGAAVTQKYFELGITEFIEEIARLDDEERQALVAQVFVYAIVSFRDVYYQGDIGFEAFQIYLEDEFREQMTLELSENEEAVVYMILDQIEATYEWYN